LRLYILIIIFNTVIKTHTYIFFYIFSKHQSS